MHILLVDDHDLFRRGLVSALQELCPKISISEADSLASVRSQIASLEHSLDLVLLDYELPDGHGTTLLKELRQSYPLLPIAMLSAHEHHELMRQTIDMGALGFIPKSTSTPILIVAIQLILSGGTYIPPSLTSCIQQSTINTPPATLYNQLTPRQKEVLHLLRKGLSNKEIGRSLDITDATVKAHATAIFKSHGVNSRSKLLAMKDH
ncbi:MAG: response regulator transcription factor [Ghiorsea sp.]|nr:response regulator transcription factor [Ghiorsea sp.]